MNFDASFCNISRCVPRFCTLQVIKIDDFFSYINNNNRFESKSMIGSETMPSFGR